MSTYQSASYWQFRIQGSIEQVLHNHHSATAISVYETASSSQIDKLTSTISLSFIIYNIICISNYNISN